MRTTINKMCYVTSVVKENKVTSGGCNSTTTTYYYCDFTYYLYNRVQREYEKTTSTKFYNTTNGLTGWKIGDRIYQPGETITVSGSMRAVPVIGALKKTFLREESSTVVHTTLQDVAAGTSNSTGSKTETQDRVVAQTKYSLPTGYAWFNSADPYDASTVNTTETQYGDDYTKGSN